MFLKELFFWAVSKDDDSSRPEDACSETLVVG
jgi:hypothetical protein